MPTLVVTERQLGAQLAFTSRNSGHPDTMKRNKCAQQTCTRVEAVPLPLEAKASLVEGAVLPKVLFDCAVTYMPKRNLSNWRARATHAIWGRGKFRCPELIFTLLCRGHAADPLQARVLRILKCARRMLNKFPSMHALWASVLATRLHCRSRMMAGPVN